MNLLSLKLLLSVLACHIIQCLGLSWQQDLCISLKSDGLREDLGVGNTIGFLRADGSLQITYGTTSSIFAVNEQTGRVQLGIALDREVTQTVNVTFFSKDTSGNQILSTCNINILDVNDNSPVFVQLPYSAVVNENAAVDTTVYDLISVTDKDMGDNAIVKLSCHIPAGNTLAQDACKHFQISQEMISPGNYKGKVTVKEKLDFETTNNFVMTIKAEDTGTPARSSEVNIEIQVQDVQDLPPIFLTEQMSLSVPENTNVNAPLEPPIQVRDQDTGVSRPLTVKIISDPNNLFTLGTPVISAEQQNLYTVNLMTRANIDREVIGNIYTVEVQAVELDQNNQETTATATLQITISITDQNDNSPSFNSQNYNIQAPEQEQEGTDLPGLAMIVTDLDVGDNAFYELSIQDDPRNQIGVSMSSVYSVSPVSGTGTTSVALVVKEQSYTDFEIPAYRIQYLQVVAKETKTVESRSSTATVMITLSDKNDNLPQFIQNQYTVFKREDIAIGSSVITITATDADSGVFGEITYSMTGTGSDKFAVNKQTGEITLSQKLDFELKKVYDFQFQATDGGGRTQRVPFRLYLTNYNDEGPVFNQELYGATLLENAVVLQPSIQVMAVDVDSDFPVTYTIISGNTPDRAFHIDNITGVVSVIRPIDVKEAPNQNGRFELLVEGSDNGREITQKSTVYVIITIRDLNNNAPVFGRAIYYATVPEITTLDTPVVNVTATDLDMNKNALIKYVIHQGHKDNFKIDENTGMISPAVSDLNIERFSNKYDIVVHAVDGGSPQNTGTALVKITVTDSNNQIPDFSQSTYVLTVSEDASIGTTVDTLTASDTDTTASVVYKIKSGSITAKDKNGNSVSSTTPFNYLTAFVVNPSTGAILTSTTLNRNQVAEVSFIIQANDTNAEFPNPQVGEATVQINILPPTGVGIKFPDQGTDNPVFAITVPEETAVKSPLLQISATDVQTGSQIVDYRKVPGSDTGNFFIVEQATGRILLNKRLDYETLVSKVLSFQLQAFSNPPTQSAVATVKVTVTDINDHSPSFDENRYSYSVPENYLYPSPLGLPVKATDTDSGNFSIIQYSITGQGYEMFIIDPVTGVITVAPNVTLDRETKAVYSLLVHAADNVGGIGEKRITSVPLDITLQDINDNAPLFQQSSYSIYTLESVKADASLGQVTARDEDSGLNGHIDYSLLPTSDLGLFYIETQTGIIRSKVSLEQKARDLPYQLTVMAKDPTSQPLSSQVSVNIYVNDLSSGDGKPRIIFPAEDETFQLPENSGIGTNVTEIKAEERNPSPGSHITYGFLANEAINADSSKFHIDPDTGVITVKDTIDYESKQTYEIIIVITTNTVPPQQVQRRIYINVTDMEDNMPSFRCPQRDFVNPIFTSVLEEQPPGEFVARVFACDADGPGNNAIYYSISCGNTNDSYFGNEPFYIDSRNGTIYTNVKLDREYQATYDICITALNIPKNTPKRTKRQAESDKVQKVRISVLDINDNGPKFAANDQQRYKAGVLATARYETPVIQVEATDADTNPNFIQLTYSLRNENFIRAQDKRNEQTPLAFKIDPATGVVTTNLNNYLSYLDGYFVMKVVATAQRQAPAETDLYIYVVREFQRLRFIFNQKPNEVKGFYQDFLKEVRMPFSPTYQINTDSMHYHILEEGRVNFDKTDLCFHMVNENTVVNADTALDIFNAKEKDFQEMYYKYNVNGVDICEVKTTTKFWSGYWWLWWLLIALAIFIFVVAAIMICCICCFWPKYKRNYQREKPYVILDPPMSMPDYEWQEEIVMMD